MVRYRHILVPVIKYNEAKEYQRAIKQTGLKLPLWCCLTEVEKRNSILEKESFRRYGRLL